VAHGAALLDAEAMSGPFVLVHQQARQRATEAIKAAPDGWVVRISAPRKSRDQEERYHAMLGDIADQWELHGRKWDAESMKRLCIDQFKRDTIRDPDFSELWKAMGDVEMAPSIDATGVVVLGTQSRKFPKKLASAFIEWLYALGAEVGIVWTEPEMAIA
jgi:hypothetical protein